LKTIETGRLTALQAVIKVNYAMTETPMRQVERMTLKSHQLTGNNS